MKRLRKIIAAAAVCTLAFSAMGCKMIEKTPEAIANTVYATVGDSKITKSDFDKEFESFLSQNYGVTIDQLKQQYGDDYANNAQLKDQLKQIKQSCLQNMINTQIMLQQTDLTVDEDDIDKQVNDSIDKIKANYDNDDDKYQQALQQAGYTEDQFKADQEKQLKLQDIYKQITGDIEVTDDDVETYYNENVDQYTTSAGADCSHILISEKDDDGNIDYDASLTKAQEVKSKLDAGADFGEMAKEYSTDSSKDKGGSLGYVTYDQANYDKDFLAAFKDLTEGQISDPVKTQFGYHIIKATGLKSETVKSLDEVKDTIKQQLLQQKQQQAYTDQINTWKENIKVKTYEDRM